MKYYPENSVLIRSYSLLQLREMSEKIRMYPKRKYPFSLAEIEAEFSRRFLLVTRDDYRQISHS